VSIAEVAKKANASPVTIYNYFGNKDDLVRHVIVSFSEEVLEKYEQILEEEIPFSQKMEKIIFNSNETTVKLNPIFQQLSKDKDLFTREFIDEFYKNKSIPFLMKVIEQGRQEGSMDANISIDAILCYVRIFKEAVSQTEFLTHHQHILGDLNKLFYYGLMGKKTN
jgi:AcrR family transcriptional regulator